MSGRPVFPGESLVSLHTAPGVQRVARDITANVQVVLGPEDDGGVTITSDCLHHTVSGRMRMTVFYDVFYIGTSVRVYVMGTTVMGDVA